MIFSCRMFFLTIAFFMSLTAVAADQAGYYQVSLTASAEQEVTPDLMRITFYSEARDKDAMRLAQMTTKALNAAIEKARLVDGITIQSGSHTVYPIHDKEDQEVIAWQERAELHLESGDFTTLTALSAGLVGDLKIASQHFLLSKTRQKEVENRLIEAAIIAFGERAQIATSAIGGKSYKIMQLSLETQGAIRPLLRPRNMIMASQANDEAMIPQIEAGTHEVVVGINGLIEIEM